MTAHGEAPQFMINNSMAERWHCSFINKQTVGVIYKDCTWSSPFWDYPLWFWGHLLVGKASARTAACEEAEAAFTIPVF